MHLAWRLSFHRLVYAQKYEESRDNFIVVFYHHIIIVIVNGQRFKVVPQLPELKQQDHINVTYHDLSDS